MEKELIKIINEHAPKLRPVGFGITAPELSALKGIGVCSARRLLVKLASEGILKRERMVFAGKVFDVYNAPDKQKG